MLMLMLLVCACCLYNIYTGDEAFADRLYTEAVQKGLVRHWSSTHYNILCVDGSLQGYVTYCKQFKYMHCSSFL
jgi:hypothetical protein